jgi:anti-sigma factor RsiW
MTSSNIQSPVASSACPPPGRLDAYYDNELTVAERGAIEPHLATCAACSQALMQIASASSLMKSIELPEMSQVGRARVLRGLTDSAIVVRDRWILPIRLLTAVAAAVFLLASCLILYQIHHGNPANPGGGNVQPIVNHAAPGSAHIMPTGETNPAQP